MAGTIDRPPLPRDPTVVWSRLKLRWPFLVWLLAAVGAGWLYYHGGRSGPLTGVVEAVREQVAPLETARLVSVEVEPAQEVRKGDILARMDTRIIDAELEVERLSLERQFEAEVRRIEDAARDRRISQAEYQAELDVLDPEIERLQSLLSRGLVDAQAVTALRARRESLARALELFPATLAAYERDLEAAKRQRDAVARSFAAAAQGGSPAADPPSSAGLLALRRESYTLRATRDGIVSRVYKEPGDVVVAGDPVMTVVVRESVVVICFLPENQAHDLRVGMKALLSRPLGEGPVIGATVTSLGPEVLALPGRVSPIPGQTVRGRRVMLVPDEPADLLPGEAMTVRVPGPTLREVLSFGRTRDRSRPGGGF